MNNHLDPYGYMIPEIFPTGEAYDPNAPLNVVTSCDCEFWFDGLDASTFTLNVANVIQWDDKSGNARHVLNGVDANRPTYIPATGRVAFVAANGDYLKNVAFGALAEPNTVFVVAKITGALTDSECIFTGNPGGGDAFIMFGSQWRINGDVYLIDGASDNNNNIHTGLFNGVSSEYWINGASVASGNSGTGTIDQIMIGALVAATYNADCEIMEVIGYNCDITDAERNAVTAYLNTKWEVY